LLGYCSYDQCDAFLVTSSVNFRILSFLAITGTFFSKSKNTFRSKLSLLIIKIFQVTLLKQVILYSVIYLIKVNLKQIQENVIIIVGIIIIINHNNNITIIVVVYFIYFQC
jgi:hypothetical protein